MQYSVRILERGWQIVQYFFNVLIELPNDFYVTGVYDCIFFVLCL